MPKKNAPCTVEEKAAWCPNPAWRQVWAKTGVLAGERRIFADWSPHWARAGVLPNPPVFSPRRNGGSYPGCESNWLSLLFPLPLRGWLTTAGWRTTDVPSPGVKSRIGGPQAPWSGRFKGVWGEIRNPPTFLFGGRGGTRLPSPLCQRENKKTARPNGRAVSMLPISR